MIRDEDVIKGNTGKYMKRHERILYILALAFGVMLAIAGIILLAFGFWIVGAVLLLIGICEAIGVGILLWTEGEKVSKL